jgi:hypothetical protein
MTEAQTQVDSALSGNTSCTQDSDCILVPSPCEVIENSCGFGFSAVNLAGQEAVEHAFSVTSAEVCATCTPEPTDQDDDGDGEACTSGTPAAACSGNSCVVVAAVPDGGSFEWACGFSCTTSDEYCDVESEVMTCPGESSYIALLADAGTCEEITFSFGGNSCNLNTDCDLGENCTGDTDETSGTCTTQCPNAQQPTFCDGGCQLTSDNHGCEVCFCPSGCPVFEDAGDGG